MGLTYDQMNTQLLEAVAKQKTVLDSAIAFIAAQPAIQQKRIDDAVAAAIAAGATEEQVAAFTSAIGDIQTESDQVAAALTAGTPDAGTAPTPDAAAAGITAVTQ